MRRTLERLYKHMLYILAGFLLFIFLVNGAIYLYTRPYIFTQQDSVPKAQAALIPGAAVAGGKLSEVFEARVEAAIDLYRRGTVSKILVSGDNSTVNYNEVNPVKNYLLAKGVPEENIFLDHAGFDTYSTLYRAKEIFKAESVIITSQAFHVPRAVFIGRALGIPAYGFVAEGPRSGAKNYVREVFANEKAVWNILTHRKPKYLGDAVPLD